MLSTVKPGSLREQADASPQVNNQKPTGSSCYRGGSRCRGVIGCSKWVDYWASLAGCDQLHRSRKVLRLSAVGLT